jgi:membrane-associated protease RseP (regulator of RpoE activity)
MSRSFWITSVVIALLGAGMARAEEKPIQLKGGTIQLVVEPEKAEAVKLGEYWLGLAVSVPNAELRKEMKLPEDQGLVVENIVPDSPAAKTNLKVKDVLLKAGDQPLRTVQDLIDVVNATKDKQLTIELLRDGKQEKVMLTPAKRPALPPTPHEAFEKWLEQLEGAAGREGKGAHGPWQFRIIGPGAIVPPDVLKVLPRFTLPDDMTVTITKTGKNPAQIVVKQGEEKWEVTEEQLDKLPEKVRRYVDPMLGRMSFGLGGGWGAGIRVFAPGEGPVPLQKVVPERVRVLPPESRLEKRIEELHQRIDKLSKMVEELKEGQRPRLYRGTLKQPIQEKPQADKPAKGEDKPAEK